MRITEKVIAASVFAMLAGCSLFGSKDTKNQPAPLVELKASFDEQDNIGWARDLEHDGIRVVLSPARFKVHAKICLIVRREDGELRRVAYIGTGNMNAGTARSRFTA